MKLKGKSILNLPPCHSFIVPVTMYDQLFIIQKMKIYISWGRDSEDRPKYDALVMESKSAFEKVLERAEQRREGELMESDTEGSMNHIFEILIRMRQICDHISLIKNRRIDIALAALPADIAKDPVRIEEARRLYAILLNNENEECAICLEPLENAVITVCSHLFCEACIDKVIEASSTQDKPRGYPIIFSF